MYSKKFIRGIFVLVLSISLLTGNNFAPVLGANHVHNNDCCSPKLHEHTGSMIEYGGCYQGSSRSETCNGSCYVSYIGRGTPPGAPSGYYTDAFGWICERCGTTGTQYSSTSLSVGSLYKQHNSSIIAYNLSCGKDGAYQTAAMHTHEGTATEYGGCYMGGNTAVGRCTGTLNYAGTESSTCYTHGLISVSIRQCNTCGYRVGTPSCGCAQGPTSDKCTNMIYNYTLSCGLSDTMLYYEDGTVASTICDRIVVGLTPNK